MAEQQVKRKCIVFGADKQSLHHIKGAARLWYDVLDTVDPEHSLKLLGSHSDVSVFIAQHGADQFDCIGLLEKVRAGYPQVRRVVMTSYLELSRIVAGLHNGTIQRLVQSPINTPEFQRAIIPLAAQQATATRSAPPQRLAG